MARRAFHTDVIPKRFFSSLHPDDPELQLLLPIASKWLEEIRRPEEAKEVMKSNGRFSFKIDVLQRFFADRPEYAMIYSDVSTPLDYFRYIQLLERMDPTMRLVKNHKNMLLRHKWHPNRLMRPLISGENEQAPINGLLDKLPQELILVVADALESADLLSFAAVCRLFRRMVSDGMSLRNKARTLELEPHDELVARLIYDVYRRHATWDDNDAAQHPGAQSRYACERCRMLQKSACKQDYACSFCMIDHRAAKFTDEELAKSAFVRRCKATSARYLLCPHKGLTFQELWALKRECHTAQHQEIRIECKEDDCHCINKIGVLTEWPDRLFITVQFPLTDLNFKKDLSLESIAGPTWEEQVYGDWPDSVRQARISTMMIANEKCSTSKNAWSRSHVLLLGIFIT